MFFKGWRKVARVGSSSRGQRRGKRRGHKLKAWFKPRLEVLEDRLAPANLTVTSNQDPTTFTPGTLRYAINQANTDATNGITDTIIFDPSLSGAMITLSQGPLELSGAPPAGSAPITIDASALAGGITVSGNNQSQIFQVDAGATVSLSGLTLQGGVGGYGGAIYNAGNLTLADSTLTGNRAQVDGGAIATYGVLNVANTVFSSNSAWGQGGALVTGFGTTTSLAGCTFLTNTGGDGGAIHNDTTLTVTGSTFSGNSTRSGAGGAVINYDTATITASSFTNNASSVHGGAIYNAGSLTLADSTLSGNAAQNDGGAIATYGVLNATNTYFSTNSAGGQGGAIVTGSGTTTSLAGCTFLTNTGGDGGAIHNDTTLTVTTSTFVGNSTRSGDGGAIINYGTATISASTFTRNTTSGNGGALANPGGALTVTNATLAGNTAGALGGGSANSGWLQVLNATLAGDAAGNGGGIANYGPGQSLLTNTIVANSPTGSDLYSAPGSSGFSGTNDLIGDGSDLGSFTSSRQGNPLLAPLGSYGGSTDTMALLPGSPAIDAGTSAGAPNMDQRGYGRVGAVDIGAFESQGFTLTVNGGNSQRTQVNTAFGNPLEVQIAANNPLEPVDGGRVTFTAPAGGASAALSAGSAAISGGLAAVTATPNGIIGAYTVSATTTGVVSGANFSLANSPRNVYWSGFAGDGKWDNPSNWSLNPVPQLGDSVLLGPNDAVLIDNRTEPYPFTVTQSAAGDSVYSLTSEDALVLSSGSLSVAANSTIDNTLTVAGGMVMGSGNLTVNALLKFDSGRLIGPAGSTVIAAGGITFIGDTGDGYMFITGRTVVNQGAGAWTGGTVNFTAGGNFTNAPNMTFDDSTDGYFGLRGGWSGSAFNNQGSFVKSAGGGTATIDLDFNNSGSVVVQAGDLTLGDDQNTSGASSGSFSNPGGTLTFQGTQDFTGSIQAQQVRFSGWATVAGSYSASAGTTAGGSVQFTGTVQGVGALSIPQNGVADFSPAAGSPVSMTLSSLDMQGGYLQGSDSYVVSGPFTWHSGRLVGAAGSTLIAAGGITFAGDTGDGYMFITGRSVVNQGAAAWTGGTLQFTGGGSFTNAAGATFDDRTDGYFGLRGGWSGSAFNNQGSFVKSAGGGTATFDLDFNNSGSVAVQAGNLTLGDIQNTSGTSSGSFSNPGGTLTFLGSQDFTDTSSIQAQQVSFWGYGTVAGSYSASAATTTFGNVQFTGPVQSVGALQSGNGVVDFSPAAGGPVTVTLAGLNLQGGWLQGSDNFVVDGPFMWHWGRLVGAAGSTVTAAGGITFAGDTGDGTMFITGRSVVNDGAAAWTGGIAQFTSGGSFTNAPGATFDDSTDGYFGLRTGWQGSAFNNQGSFVMSAPGQADIGMDFNNSGSVDVKSGTLTIQSDTSTDPGAYVQTAGTTLLDGGNLAGQISIQGGLLQGSGSITGNVSNGGTVVPTAPPGPINITGNYTASATADFQVTIAGPVAGSQYSQLSVSAAVQLAGTLGVSLASGFTPLPGATFTILDNQGTAAVTGTFAGLPEGALVPAGGGTFQISYRGGDGNDVVLSNFTVPLTATGVSGIPAVEGQGLSNVVVATLTDQVGNGTTAGYSATVTWDDGNGASHTSVGRVQALGGTSFAVYADNTSPYAEQGSYSVSVLIQDQGRSSATANSTATVADAPLIVAAPAVPTTASLLKDIGVVPQNPNPQNLTAVGGTLYFVVDEGTTTQPLHQLWKYDASGVTEIPVGSFGYPNPYYLTAVGNTVYFTASDGSGRQLWKYDGSAPPTEIRVGSATNPFPYDLTAVANTLYFSASDGAGDQLWKYDGSALSEIPVGSSASPNPYDLTAVGSTLYFSAWDGAGRQLWKYDGSALTEVRVGSATNPLPQDLTAVGSTLYFSAYDGAGSQLWKYDGSALTEVRVGSSPHPYHLTAVGSTLYFSAYDGAGSQLWKYDGSALAEIPVGSSATANPQDLTAVGNTLYFSASDGAGDQLWKYDGSALSEIPVGSSATPDPEDLTAVGSTLYFGAWDGAGYQLWKYDGSALTEVRVGSSGDSFPYDLTVVGSTLYFSAYDGVFNGTSYHRQLWSYDASSGTVTQQVLVASSASSSPSPFVQAGGKTYFAATDGVYGQQLWSTDGTPARTVRISDGNVAGGGLSPTDLTAVGNTLYFSANDGTGNQLWKYDGRALSEVRVGSAANPFPQDLTAVGSTLYFNAWDGAGYQLWKYDGSAVAQIPVGASPNPNPQDLTAVGSTLYFNAYDGAGDQLWKYDGSALTEVRVGSSAKPNPYDLTAVGSTLYFGAWDGASYQLWKYDGTPPTEIPVGSSGDRLPNDLTVVGSTLYFSAYDGAGYQLWKYDGSALTEVRVGSSGDSFPYDLTAVGSTLYFSAFDGPGRELWKYDGSTLSKIVINPAGPSEPTNLSAIGNALYLNANDGTHGYEPWVVRPTITAVEGQGLSNVLVATFSDPGSDGTAADYSATVTWDDGNGASHTSAGRVQPLGGNTFAVYADNTSAYADDGSYGVGVVIADSGGSTTVATSTVVVANVAPTATLSGNGPVTYGSPATVTFSNPYDPSPVDTSAGFHYAFALDANSLAGATYANSGSNPSASFQLGVGSYTVYGRIIDEDNAFTAYQTTVTVNPGAPTIVFAGPGYDSTTNTYTFTYDATPHGASGAVTGVTVNGSPEALGSPTFTYYAASDTGHLDPLPTPVHAGSYDVVASYAGSSNYQSATASAQLIINPAPLAVTVASQTLTYGGSLPANAVSYSGLAGPDANPNGTPKAGVLGGTLAYVYQDANGNTLLPVHAGSYAIVASGLSSGDYGISYQKGTLTINSAPLTVTVDEDPATAVQDAFWRAYGQANPSFSARYDGLVNGDSTASLGGNLLYSTGATPSSDVGTYGVSASGLTSTDYIIRYVDDILNITAAATGLALAVPVSSPTYGQPITFTATVSNTQSGVAPGGSVQFFDGATPLGTAISPSSVSGNTAAWTFSTTLPAGSHNIGAVFSSEASGDFQGSSNTAPLTVNKANQTISFGALAGMTYGNADFALTATASSSLPVNYSASGSAQVYQTAQGTWMVHITGAGTATMTAHQAGNANYNAAADVSQTLSIARAPLTVTVKSYLMLVGNQPPAVSGTVTGLVNGDTVSLAYSTTVTSKTPSGQYTVNTASVSGASLVNYNLSIINGTMDVVSLGADPSATGKNAPKNLNYWANAPTSPITAADLTALDGLNLVDNSGKAFHPTSATQLESWLGGVSSRSSWSYQLSTQLAVMELNVLSGFGSGTDLVYAGGLLPYGSSYGIGGLTAGGFISVQNLMTAANAMLLRDPNGTAGDPNNGYLQALWSALQAANNNTSFVKQELTWNLVTLYQQGGLS
jgi:ELWxxDGT repeat protein